MISLSKKNQINNERQKLYDLGYNATKMAEILGCDRTTISKWLKGKDLISNEKKDEETKCFSCSMCSASKCYFHAVVHVEHKYDKTVVRLLESKDAKDLEKAKTLQDRINKDKINDFRKRGISVSINNIGDCFVSDCRSYKPDTRK